MNANVNASQLVDMGQKGNTNSFEGSILDWEVTKRKQFFHAPARQDESAYADNLGLTLIESDTLATVREDTGQQIGTVGAGYEIIQNSQLFEGLCNSLEGHDFTIANMGMTDGGGRVFIQADVGGHSDFSINGDAFKGYLTMWSSHDGSCSTVFGDTLTRLTCMNQFYYTKAKSKKDIVRMTVRKTKSARWKFNGMIEAMANMIDSRSDFIERCERLMNTPMNDDDARLFSLGYHNSVKSRGANLANHIHGLYRSGMGNNGETRYDMFNAFTEFHTHGYEDSKRSKDSQIKTSMVGAGHRTKHKVLDILGDNDRVKATIAQGRIIDRELAVSI